MTRHTACDQTVKTSNDGACGKCQMFFLKQFYYDKMKKMGTAAGGKAGQLRMEA